jgi:hypothetical protein
VAESQQRLNATPLLEEFERARLDCHCTGMTRRRWAAIDEPAGDPKAAKIDCHGKSGRVGTDDDYRVAVHDGGMIQSRNRHLCIFPIRALPAHQQWPVTQRLSVAQTNRRKPSVIAAK